MSEPVESPKPKRKNAPRAAAVVPPGYTEAPKRLSLEQASEWARGVPVLTVDMARQMIKEGQWPSNIPTNPDKTYPDFTSKGGWPAFLRAEKRVERWSYEKVKEWARGKGIKSGREWIGLATSKALPEGVPRHISRSYPLEFEEDKGWGGFFGTGKRRQKDIQKATFEEAGEWAREKGLATVVEWLAWMREHPGERPEHIPAAPASAYPDFIERGGWNAFLGTRALSGSSASERVIGQEIQVMISEKVEKGYRITLESGREKRFDLVIPEKKLVIEYDGWYFHRDHVERDLIQTAWLKRNGWTVIRIREHPLELLDPDWDMFVDKKKTYFSKCLAVMVHLEERGLLEMGSAEKYEEKGGLWTDIKNLTQWKSWEEASNWFKSQEIKDSGEWKKWQKENQRPDDIPACPEGVYQEWRERGGWGAFLGTGSKSPVDAREAYRKVGFEVTRNWFRSQGIKTFKEWLIWQKENDRPHHITSSPNKVFEKEFTDGGGWGGFFGVGNISNRTRSKNFFGYEDCQKWFQEKGFKRRSEWIRWSFENEKPVEIPAHPDMSFHDFKERGGWKEFLGISGLENKKRLSKRKKPC